MAKLLTNRLRKKKKSSNALTNSKSKLEKNFGSIPTIGTNSKTRKDFTLDRNTTGATDGVCKDLSYFIYFNYDKKSYYTSTCTRPRKDCNTLKN